MPTTPIYGFDYEALTDPPGETLHGGLTGTHPILALQVESRLNQIDTQLTSDVSQVQNQVDDLETLFADTGVKVLDIIDTGAGSNTTEFINIDQTYRDLMIFWRGQSDGAGEIDAMVMRFNDDSGTNYKWIRNRNTAASAYLSENDTTTALHVGYTGTVGSCGSIIIPSYSNLGITKFARGSSTALGQSLGTNIFTTDAGGRWNSISAISAIRLWPSGQNWETSPRITLMGIPHG